MHGPSTLFAPLVVDSLMRNEGCLSGRRYRVDRYRIRSRRLRLRRRWQRRRRPRHPGKPHPINDARPHSDRMSFDRYARPINNSGQRLVLYGLNGHVEFEAEPRPLAVELSPIEGRSVIGAGAAGVLELVKLAPFYRPPASLIPHQILSHEPWEAPGLTAAPTAGVRR